MMNKLLVVLSATGALAGQLAPRQLTPIPCSEQTGKTTCSDNAYSCCDVGEYCIPGACCPIGKICNGGAGTLTHIDINVSATTVLVGGEAGATETAVAEEPTTTAEAPIRAEPSSYSAPPADGGGSDETATSEAVEVLATSSVPPVVPTYKEPTATPVATPGGSTSSSVPVAGAAAIGINLALAAGAAALLV